MELQALIDGLSRPAAYTHPVESVEIHQTHISVVFLAGALAYKIKKPVDLGFVNYGTLEHRRHYCEEEVRLNRRLAASVYRGVVPVTRDGSETRMDGRGTVVESAVKMKRLPDSATLGDHLARGEVPAESLDELARRLARFHAIRIEHIYWFPENRDPDDWVIVDCIEFDERFRHADPIADLAFLAMELTLDGKR